jgi:DNA-binding MarR family transcriptional regulator
MRHAATSDKVGDGLERIVVASVAVTARALAEAAPDLTLLQWRLLVLIDTPQGMGVGQVAAALGAKIAAVSRLIGRLRARGLVETRRGEGDARLVFVSLTAKGRKIRRRVVERRRAELRDAVSRTRLPDNAIATIDWLADALGVLA